MLSRTIRGRAVRLLVPAAAALALGLAATALGATFTGTTGPDTIYGTDTDDTISTGLGNDTVWAGVGNDTVKTAAGADKVDASRPIDQSDFACLADDDTVDGGGGPDQLTGGNRTECFFGHDHDVLNGQGGADTIDVRDRGLPEESDTANGGRGNDTCLGDEGDVFLSCETVTLSP